uniref:LIM zinc-binding domain-containing protein n=1 Tax=Hucho hucho TaxID=62062 RepID=A0A4W5QYB7_9TELE
LVQSHSCPQGAVWPCAGCGESIRDPVVLRVGSNQQWHTRCLYCDECHCPLGESVSCFLRDGRTLFGGTCGGCGEAVLSSDLVVRAGRQNYHPDCLHCSLCGALLMPGDSFTLGPGGPCCQPDRWWSSLLSPLTLPSRFTSMSHHGNHLTTKSSSQLTMTS